MVDESGESTSRILVKNYCGVLKMFFCGVLNAPFEPPAKGAFEDVLQYGVFLLAALLNG